MCLAWCGATLGAPPRLRSSPGSRIRAELRPGWPAYLAASRSGDIAPRPPSLLGAPGGPESLVASPPPLKHVA
eukprot:6677231-Alexandrium_andersonii.AAC.1